MFTTNFGIEIEMTGITREKAAEVTAEHLNGRIARSYDGYDTHAVTAEDGRVWKLMSDASIGTQKKQGGRKVYADRSYSVELVSPILNYQDDIEKLQELVRKLRKAGAFTNSTLHAGKIRS